MVCVKLSLYGLNNQMDNYIDAVVSNRDGSFIKFYTGNVPNNDGVPRFVAYVGDNPFRH